MDTIKVNDTVAWNGSIARGTARVIDVVNVAGDSINDAALEGLQRSANVLRIRMLDGNREGKVIRLNVDDVRSDKLKRIDHAVEDTVSAPQVQEAVRTEGGAVPLTNATPVVDDATTHVVQVTGFIKGADIGKVTAALADMLDDISLLRVESLSDDDY